MKAVVKDNVHKSKGKSKVANRDRLVTYGLDDRRTYTHVGDPSQNCGPCFDHSYCYSHGDLYFNDKTAFFQSKELPKIGICLPCSKKALKFESCYFGPSLSFSNQSKIKPEKESKEKVKEKARSRYCFFPFNS